MVVLMKEIQCLSNQKQIQFELVQVVFSWKILIIKWLSYPAKLWKCMVLAGNIFYEALILAFRIKLIN